LGLGFAQAASDLAHFLIGFELDCSEVKHFYSYQAFSLVIHTFIDLAECTSSDLVVHDVFINSCIGYGFPSFAVLFVA